MLLRALKGAPLSVLLAVRHLGRAGTNDLEAVTGYEQDAVTKALRALAAMRFIIQRGRYQGWQLTPLAVQLPLFILSELNGDGLNIEAGKTGLEAGKTGLPLLGGGGGLSDNEEDPMLINTTTTTAREAGKTGLEAGKTGLNLKKPPTSASSVDNSVDSFIADAETARLAEILVARVQCPRPRALQAVATARAADAWPAEIEIEILRWLAWFNSEKTNTAGIRNPAYFIASKIANREPEPAGQHVVSWSEDDQRIQRLLDELERIYAAEDAGSVGDRPEPAAEVDGGH